MALASTYEVRVRLNRANPVPNSIQGSLSKCLDASNPQPADFAISIVLVEVGKALENGEDI
jgi:hypothetical protein